MRPRFFLVPFLLLPLLEVVVLVQASRLVGGWWVLFAVVVQGLLGSWIVKREGSRAWQRLNEPPAAGRVPEQGGGDAALILLGGLLLAVPGLLTDLPALLLLLPFTRPLVRGRLLAWAERRAAAGGLPGFPGGFPPPGPPFGEHPQRPRPGGVIRGEVIKDDPPSGRPEGRDTPRLEP